MRSVLAFVALVTGCGRVGFDGAVDAGGADVADGAPDAFACQASGVDALDEDGDGVANGCDVCPHLPDPGQADGDGDRVGDACDPEPAVGRQRIAFFDGFDVVRPEWAAPHMVAGGIRQVGLNGPDPFATLLLPMTAAHFEVGGATTAVGPGGAASPQVFIGTVNGDGVFYYVELIDEGTGRRRSLMRELEMTYVEYDGLREDGVPIALGPLAMSLAVSPTGFGAVVDHGGIARAFSAPLQGGVAGPSVFVYAGEIGVALAYAILIVDE